MAPLITVEQLQERPGFADADPGELAALLDDVSALVADIADPVELDSATLPPAIVPVIVSMVRRGLQNPRGLTGEQLGDYGWQAQGQGPAGTIYATRREVKLIRRAAGTPGAGSITLVSPYSGDTSSSEGLTQA